MRKEIAASLRKCSFADLSEERITIADEIENGDHDG
jgi:hypothetical protein